MTLLSITKPAVDNTTAEAADVNTPLDQIVNHINGSLDSSNISSLSGAKLTPNTVPASALSDSALSGWVTGKIAAPNTVTYNGNRSYSMVFNGVDYSTFLSPGMAIRTTRTTSSPIKCARTIGASSQNFTKSSPAGMTFTDDFFVCAWIKLTAVPPAGGVAIISRYDGNNGWYLGIDSYQTLQLVGFNGGSANLSQVYSSRAVPLNEWVFVCAQLDMSAFTASTSTSYMMFDGVDVPVSVQRQGTNPTSLVQGGTLEVGSQNGAKFFTGEISNVAVFSTKVAQSTALTFYSQALTGSESGLASGYTFNNSLNDLNTSNANNLTANNSADSNFASSPFGSQANGTNSATLDYAKITSVSYSTNTTVTVQCPTGCTIPYTVNAVAYSTHEKPFNFIADKSRYNVVFLSRVSLLKASPTANVWYSPDSSVGFPVADGAKIKVPIGTWRPSVKVALQSNTTSSGNDGVIYAALSTANNTPTDTSMVIIQHTIFSSVTADARTSLGDRFVQRHNSLRIGTSTDYYLIFLTNGANNIYFRGDVSPTAITFELEV